VKNSLAMNEEILRSPRYTDFGRYCFYVGDDFPTAIRWAFNRHDQAAVVVFKMEDNWTQNIREDRKISFDHTNPESLNEWKEFVFNSRSRLDNHYHYINGPILANSRRMDFPNEAITLSTGNVIPYQTAVRTNQLCEEFRSHILCIIFFRSGTTLSDNGIY